MFGFFAGAIIDRPQTTAKQKTGDQWSPVQIKIGRDVVFSADFICPLFLCQECREMFYDYFFPSSSVLR
jgi:hypothetical protein